MVWFAIWSSVTLEPRCLDQIRLTCCNNLAVPRKSDDWVLGGYNIIHPAYRKNISDDISTYIHRRRKPSNYLSDLSKYAAISKWYDPLNIQGTFSYVVGMNSVCHDKMNRGVLLIQSITRGPFRFQPVFENMTRHYSRLEYYTYPTPYDHAYIYEYLKCEARHPIRPATGPVTLECILYYLSLVMGFPIRYIKAVIKCFVLRETYNSPSGFLKYLYSRHPQYTQIERVVIRHFNVVDHSRTDQS